MNVLRRFLSIFNTRFLPTDAAAGVALSPGTRIICYEKPEAWILGKFARRLHSALTLAGRYSTIAKQGEPTCRIGHHIIYIDAKHKWSPIETMMVTHLDKPWKTRRVLRQLSTYDAAVCMSKETCMQLRAQGAKPRQVCYISPAHDGKVRPRPIVLGIASKVHADGRKNEHIITRTMQKLPKDIFALKIMGSGWDREVAAMRTSGCNVEYSSDFDYLRYTTEFMPSLDYFLYFSWDEGSMAFLDALSADVKTIASAQGFHLDVVGGIDFPLAAPEELCVVLETLAKERQDRLLRVSGLTWNEYALRHAVLWDFLEGDDETSKTLFDAFLAEHNIDCDSVPSAACISDLIASTTANNNRGLESQLARMGLIYHPDCKAFRELVNGFYPGFG